MAHLLLWMAGCALFLSILRQLADVRPGPLGSVIVVAASLGPGAAWAGLLVLIGRWLRGSPWPVEPGHWLLAILGAIAQNLDFLLPNDFFDPRYWLAVLPGQEMIDGFSF
ncbi:MAG: hypothetical protein WD278_00565, partial [Pirellulales bacterium]